MPVPAVRPIIPQRDTLRGIVWMLGCVLLFSVMSVFVKGVADHIPVAEIVFFRSAFGIVPVVVAILMSGCGWGSLKTDRFPGHVTRAVVGVSAMSMLFWSFALLPLADATAINFTAPLFLTALSVPFLGERVGPYRWGAVLVGFCGMLLIVHPGEGVLQLGSLVALGAAFMQACAMVAVSQLGRSEATNTIVFYFSLITTALCLIPLPFVWITPKTMVDWLMLIGCGLVGGCGQLLLTRAYSSAPAVVLAPFNYTSLLWAGLFGYALWGQVPDVQTLIGAAIVALSGIFIVYREATRRKRLQRGEET